MCERQTALPACYVFPHNEPQDKNKYLEGEHSLPAPGRFPKFYPGFPGPWILPHSSSLCEILRSNKIYRLRINQVSVPKWAKSKVQMVPSEQLYSNSETNRCRTSALGWKQPQPGTRMLGVKIYK